MSANWNLGYGYPMTPPPNVSQNTVTFCRENKINNNHRNSNSTGIFSYMDVQQEN